MEAFNNNDWIKLCHFYHICVFLHVCYFSVEHINSCSLFMEDKTHERFFFWMRFCDFFFPEVSYAPDWKNNSWKKKQSCVQLFEILASLGIMGARSRTHLNPFEQNNHITIVMKGTFNWVPIMPRNASYSDSGCKFFSVWPNGKVSGRSFSICQY